MSENKNGDEKTKGKPKPSRNPLIRSAIQTPLHPPEQKPDQNLVNVRQLRIVPDDDPDDAA